MKCALAHERSGMEFGLRRKRIGAETKRRWAGEIQVMALRALLMSAAEWGLLSHRAGRAVSASSAAQLRMLTDLTLSASLKDVSSAMMKWPIGSENEGEACLDSFDDELRSIKEGEGESPSRSPTVCLVSRVTLRVISLTLLIVVIHTPLWRRWSLAWTNHRHTVMHAQR